MTDAHDIEAKLDRLAHENAELSGLVLATGVILTQLLQAMTLRELNPQASATRVIDSARKAIEGFKPEHASPLDVDMKVARSAGPQAVRAAAPFGAAGVSRVHGGTMAGNLYLEDLHVGQRIDQRQAHWSRLMQSRSSRGSSIRNRSTWTRPQRRIPCWAGSPPAVGTRPR